MDTWTPATIYRIAAFSIVPPLAYIARSDKSWRTDCILYLKKNFDKIIYTNIFQWWLISFMAPYPVRIIFRNPKTSFKIIFGTILLFIILSFINIHTQRVQMHNFQQVGLPKRIYYFYKVRNILILILCVIFVSLLKYWFVVVGHFRSELLGQLLGQIGTQTNNLVQKNDLLLSYLGEYFLPCALTTLFIVVILHKYESLRISISRFNFKITVSNLVFIYLLFSFSMWQIVYEPASTDFSTIYEDYFSPPSNMTVQFNGPKRNVVHMFVESLENTYTSPKSGGIFDPPLIPNLERIAKENIHFSEFPDRLGGMQQSANAFYTTGSHFSQMCGVPFNYDGSLYVKSMSFRFFPGAKCLGDIFRAHGYYTEAVLGDDLNDWNIGMVYTSHGFEKVIGASEMGQNGGYVNDYITFDLAKQEYKKLEEQGKPFFLVVVTIDSHEPGFLCPHCKATAGDNKLYTATKCSDRQIGEFVEWFKQQKSYENTTLIIQGDHLVKNAGVKAIAEERNFPRRAINAVINPPFKPKTTMKQYTSLDIYPTILALAGANITNDRLGLGTNLFGSTKTLLDEMGLDKLNKELYKESKYYSSKIKMTPIQGDLNLEGKLY